MKRKVKSFFYDFGNSLIPQPRYYKRLARTPLILSIKYFFTVIFFLNMIALLLFVGKLNFDELVTMRISLEREINKIPKNLKIYIKNDALFTTHDRPYFLWVGAGDKKILLGVVDERATPVKIKEYNALFLLANNSLVVNSLKPSTTYYSIPYSNTSLTIDKQTAISIFSLFNQSLWIFALILLLVGIILVPLVGFLVNVVIVFLASSLAFFVFKLLYKKHHFGKTFQVGLHATTLPLITFQLIVSVDPMARNFTLPFFLLSLIFTLCALYETYVENSAKKSPSPRLFI